MGRKSRWGATTLVALFLLADQASGLTVLCGGTVMEPVDGMWPYIVKMAEGETAASTRAVLSWLESTYGSTEDVGTISNRATSVIGPYFVAEMSRAAVEGLAASEHADSIEYIECDVAVSATAAVAQVDNGTRSATEQALLQSILAAKYISCGGDRSAATLPMEKTKYTILLEDGVRESVDNVTDWLTATHGRNTQEMQSSSLAGIVATELERVDMEALLLRFHDSIAAVECDVLVCHANPDGTLPHGCVPDASAAVRSASVAPLVLLMLAAFLVLG